MAQRIAITGMGCVSGLAQGVEPAWSALIAGQGAVRQIERRFPGEGDYAYGGPAAVVDDLNTTALLDHYGPRAVAHLDPFALFAAVASFEAIAQAGLLSRGDILEEAVIIYGVGSGGNATMEEGYGRLFDKRLATVHPLMIPRYMVSAAASHLSILFGVKGMAYTIASACASSGHAIAEGMHMLRAGRASTVIAGGAEAPITYGGWAAWKAVKAMSSTTCRPFSQGRDGMILGEGAATLVLETWDHALARGAPVLGELIGSGASSDAFHITQPQGEGAVRALCAAYADADLPLDTPALISSHGTATEANDRTEAGALNTFFGSALDRHAVIATKSAHGHLMGGAGAIELILGVLAIQRGIAPPVLNYLGPDPNCRLPLVLGEATPIKHRHLVSNAFAFGGLNSVLIARAV